MANETFDRDAKQRTAFVAIAIMLMAASLVLVKTGRDALYFQERGLFDLPKAYIATAIASVPFAFGTLGLMRWLGPRLARIAASLTSAGVFSICVYFITPGGGLFNTTLFVVMPLAFGVLFSLGWLLAADLLDGRPSAVTGPAYGRIGAGAILGGIGGGGGAKLLAHHISAHALMWLGLGLLAAAALVMLAAQRRYPARKLTVPSTVEDAENAAGGGMMTLLRHRYALVLLVVAMTASLTAIFIEFQFYFAASASPSSVAEKASFFASFYLVLNFGALMVQLFVMPRVQRRLGVHGSLLIMPVALLSAGVFTLGSTSLLLRSGLKATEGGLKASIHRSNWEQAYLPLSQAQRSAAKLLIDGAGARIAEGLAAGLLYVWLVVAVGDDGLAGQSTRWITYLMLGSTVTWVGLTLALRRAAHDGDEAPATQEFRPQLMVPDT